MKRTLVATLIGLLCACGSKDEPGPSTSSQGESTPAKTANEKKDDAAAKQRAAEAAQARQQKIAELKGKRTNLAAEMKRIEEELRAMDKRQAEEKKALPDPRTLRPRLIQMRRDSNRESARLATMEREMAGLEKTVAKSKTSDELKKLQDEMAKLEEVYWKAHSGWMASLENKQFEVAESPVKRDLELLRRVRRQWLQATPSVRRAPVSAHEKKIINDGFRAWLGELPERERVVTEVLKQPDGPKTAPDAYDYTDLDFFLLLSIQELILEKQNIVEEKKELDENRVKLEAMEKQMDALREKIAAKRTEGGGDLEQYVDLESRLPAQRTKAADLQRTVEEYEQIFSEIEATKERHLKEQEEAAKALEKAKEELRAATAELRKLGVR